MLTQSHRSTFLSQQTDDHAAAGERAKELKKKATLIRHSTPMALIPIGFVRNLKAMQLCNLHTKWSELI